MILENVYMIRGGTTEGVGPFNTDFNIKFIFLLCTFLMILYDWKKNDRLDYLWVCIFGTLIWSAAEGFMQLLGIRDFQQNYLFGFPLPLIIAIPFQGLVEGAFIAVTCLFLGDLMREKKTRLLSILVFTGLMVLMAVFAFTQGIQVPNYGGIVRSRRNMTTLIPILLLCVLIYANIAFFIIHPREKWEGRRLGTYLKIKPSRNDRIRGYYMFLLMLIFGTVWTAAEYIAGSRWIEVGIDGSTVHADPITEFLALAWDVVVEITVAYIPFFTLPLGLKLIQSEKD